LTTATKILVKFDEFFSRSEYSEEDFKQLMDEVIIMIIIVSHQKIDSNF
jgi:hypothetical protein